MNKIKIETAQNVIIEQTPANIGERIGAFFIDGLIIFFYYIFIVFITSSFGSGDTASVILLVLLIPVFTYHLLSETFMNGQSFGKKALKIKVMKKDGTEPGFGNYLIRWIFRIVDISFYGIPAMITIAVNGKGQRIGDIVAKTTVIKTGDKPIINQTVFTETEDDYEVKYPEAEKLTDKDINTIKEVLTHYKKSPGNAISASMVKQTFDAVKKKTGINPGEKEPPAVVLETILKDYNYLNKN